MPHYSHQLRLIKISPFLNSSDRRKFLAKITGMVERLVRRRGRTNNLLYFVEKSFAAICLPEQKAIRGRWYSPHHSTASRWTHSTEKCTSSRVPFSSSSKIQRKMWVHVAARIKLNAGAAHVVEHAAPHIAWHHMRFHIEFSRQNNVLIKKSLSHRYLAH